MKEVNKFNNILNYIYIFILGCFIGYVFEVVVELVKGEGFVNRGFLYGPYLPIYGFGLVILWRILRNFKDKEIKTGKITITPFLVFIIIYFITTGIELITGLFFDRFLSYRLWDYSHMLLNYKGIIAPFSSLRFAAGGILIIYFLIPFMLKGLEKSNLKKKIIFSSIFLSIISVDFLITMLY